MPYVVKLLCCPICSNLEVFLGNHSFIIFKHLILLSLLCVDYQYCPFFFVRKQGIILLIGVPSIVVMQDYIKESDNLVSLHDQIRDCDSILSQMETLLSGFQVY